ncbi:MAG: efflux transporter outer membrane subunit [Leptospiraceae bacterium]|nr:efflux transporter outer membrane subunit [Leptospiraceae bacterium]MCK6379670.1 efflux transporter outer membrane subunit [Leptospiraceae bacterium]
MNKNFLHNVFLILFFYNTSILFVYCTVGPDFRRPQIPIPQKWENDILQDDDKNPINLAYWWKNFNDPILTELIEESIHSNLDIRQAGFRVAQARASLGIMTAGLFPELGIQGAMTRRHNSMSVSSSNNTTNTAQATSIPPSNSQIIAATEKSPSTKSATNLFQTGLTASWTLDVFGGVRRNIESANANLQMTLEDRRGIFLTLISDVATNYVNLRTFQKQISIAKEQLKIQEQTSLIMKKRYEAGFASILDTSNANALVANTKAQIPILESAEKIAIQNLSVLLGKEPQYLQKTLSNPSDIPNFPRNIPVGFPSDLVQRRPDVRKIEAQLHSATAKIGVAKSDFFPKFTLTGTVGFSGTNASDIGTSNSVFWTAGPSVSLPIFTAGRISWNVELQKSVREEVLLLYEKTLLIAFKEVESSLVSYGNEEKRLKYLQEAVENYRKSVKISMTLYIAGKTDFLNVVTAQQSLFNSENALAQSNLSLALYLISIYKALGGGWEMYE